MARAYCRAAGPHQTRSDPTSDLRAISDRDVRPTRGATRGTRRHRTPRPMIPTGTLVAVEGPAPWHVASSAGKPCDVTDSVLRWLGAVGITLAPLFLFVHSRLDLPGTLTKPTRAIQSNRGRKREGYRADAADFRRGLPMAAALGIGGFVIARVAGGPWAPSA